MKGIDFTQEHKSTLDIVLKDGTAISVLPPKIKLIGEFRKADGNDFDSVADLLSRMLSDNLQKKEVLKSVLTDDYDAGELILLLDCVTKFVAEIMQQKY